MTTTDEKDLCCCERLLVCSECHLAPENCECSNWRDDLAEAEAAYQMEDVADLGPLTLTLLGLPSGIRRGTPLRGDRQEPTT